jgi:2-methylcitrate dehydratase
VAYKIIGGGEEGDKHNVRTKEEADHSLPYLLAAAALDGDVTPRQYSPERIGREDVQQLLRRVTVRPREELSRRFPAEMPCRVRVTLQDGRVLVKEKSDYEGFLTRPTSWDGAVSKFERLTGPHASRFPRTAIIDAVASLDSIRIPELMRLLEGDMQDE